MNYNYILKDNKMNKKKPTDLDPAKVATSSKTSPHLYLSPKMGEIPSRLEVADELSKNMGLSEEALDDALKLQYNLVDLFTLGDVQMNTTMDSLFKWKDKRDEAARSKMPNQVYNLLKRYYEVLSTKIDIGQDLTWGIYNSAIRAVMASFKTDRKRMV
jgi:hypothetical protein